MLSVDSQKSSNAAQSLCHYKTWILSFLGQRSLFSWVHFIHYNTNGKILKRHQKYQRPNSEFWEGHWCHSKEHQRSWPWWPSINLSPGIILITILQVPNAYRVKALVVLNYKYYLIRLLNFWHPYWHNLVFLFKELCMAFMLKQCKTGWIYFEVWQSLHTCSDDLT